MGLRFRKSIKLAPGVKMNIGKKSAGLSIGNKYGGVTYNSKSGTHGRVSAPGTGMSYTTISNHSSRSSVSPTHNDASISTNRDTPTPRYKPVYSIIFLLLSCLFLVLGILTIFSSFLIGIFSLVSSGIMFYCYRFYRKPKDSHD